MCPLPVLLLSSAPFFFTFSLVPSSLSLSLFHISHTLLVSVNSFLQTTSSLYLACQESSLLLSLTPLVSLSSSASLFYGSSKFTSVLPEAVGGKKYIPGQQYIIDRLTTGGISFPQEAHCLGRRGRGPERGIRSHLTGNQAHHVCCLVHNKALPNYLTSSQRLVKCRRINSMLPQACS